MDLRLQNVKMTKKKSLVEKIMKDGNLNRVRIHNLAEEMVKLYLDNDAKGISELYVTLKEHYQCNHKDQKSLDEELKCYLDFASKIADIYLEFSKFHNPLIILHVISNIDIDDHEVGEITHFYRRSIDYLPFCPEYN